jgi:alkylation response protein AidB-like acyl-CoA dehydrogenase
MDLALKAVTAAGRAFQALCEGHEEVFFSTAGQHDRASSFPDENISSLRKSGATNCCIPVEQGGIGVTLLRDLVPGVTALGRGDGSTAIAINMHASWTWQLARAWRLARLKGDSQQEATTAALLREMATDRLIAAIVATENGSDYLHPLVRANRDGKGWRLSGRKAFATGSPAANIFAVRCRYTDAEGRDRIGTANIRRDTSGMVVQGNWDALGMRASGSHDVVFNDCFIPEQAITDVAPWGELSPRLLIAVVPGLLGLSACFLGIAECARGITLQEIKRRDRGDLAAIRHQVAEMEIDLCAARGTLERGAANADLVLNADALDISEDTLHALAKETQCVKWFVMRKAIDVVDRAMTISGGSSYISTNPLSRLYRDVRAGPLMQPFSPIEAFAFIGNITLGRGISTV